MQHPTAINVKNLTCNEISVRESNNTEAPSRSVPTSRLEKHCALARYSPLSRIVSALTFSYSVSVSTAPV